MAASAGAPLSNQETPKPVCQHRLDPVSLEPVPPGGGRGALQVVALVATDEAVGLMALRGAPRSKAEQELLRAFANHLALALERAGLREDAVRARLLEEVDRCAVPWWGPCPMTCALRSATIKVSASALVENGASLSPGDLKELAELVDAQADRLDRLVSNLLDMTRIQSGALELRRQPAAVADLVDEALLVLGRGGRAGDIRWRAPDDLPLVDVDHVLVRQVLANLVDNALRHSPPGAPVTVSARCVRRRQGGGPGDRQRAGGPAGPSGKGFSRCSTGGRPAAGEVSAWPSRRLSWRLTASGYGSRTLAAAAATRGASFVFTLPVLREGPGLADGPGTGHRRRQGSVACARVALSAKGHEVLSCRDGGGRPVESWPCAPRTWWCSTSGSPTSTASKSSTASALVRGARDRAVGHGSGGPQGGCPGRRRQRLRDQALRDGRAGSEDPHRAPPCRSGAVVPDEGQLTVGPIELDLVHYQVTRRR